MTTSIKVKPETRLQTNINTCRVLKPILKNLNISVNKIVIEFVSKLNKCMILFKTILTLDYHMLQEPLDVHMNNKCIDV